ncbi:autotransporter domain-containing protein [Shinella sp. NM-101]|uniref:autotransporter domain-containing protein n=1 Tax=Shinella sp. NM-101 TaxID=2744455 RepID=UPI001F213170|nr:autotransporter domain-containing protein [Shinella sp. NM-101]
MTTETPACSNVRSAAATKDTHLVTVSRSRPRASTRSAAITALRISTAIATVLGGALGAPAAFAQSVVVTGSVSPSGVTSPNWNAGSSLLVGDNGNGTMDVTGGGTVSDMYGYIAFEDGSTGAVTVTGPGSVWDNRAELYIGYNGRGSLNISDGGAVSNTWGFIGSTPNGIGDVSVDGSGSNWTSTDLHVGHFGSGDLKVTNGGTVNSDTGSVGHAYSSRGYATVGGPGSTSTWNVAGELVVGYYGRGSLRIDAGGVVTSADGYIGASATAIGPANGYVVVYGRWDNTGDLNVGYGGNGWLTISSGGHVSVGNGIVEIAADVEAIGVLNIGADPGLPVGAGTLAAGEVRFGDGAGTINFNHNNSAYLFSPLISGYGSINQNNGTTILTGDSGNFSGPTAVENGTLRVNGTLGNSASSVNVQGGVLGGSGTIGGSVLVGDGGTLAPGNSPGTLTINGNLVLSSLSILDYELGEAGTVGGAYNDLINVNGNLTLDGTLNVSQSLGGTYGAGIYRLFNYGGTLTDNGIVLGSMPGGSANYIQTSVAGQVNLVNTQGLSFRFWDGAAGPKDNGMIDGGSGTWTLAASGAQSDNWTTESTPINGAFTNGAYAVFQGAPGTVTVDNRDGLVAVSGMQFAVDGYSVTGGGIELLAGSNDVRVGDGTASSTVMTATIESGLWGSGGLNKTDLGTLVLTANNTYSGGTRITGGALIGSATSFGSGAIIDNAALVLDQPTDAALSNAISGTGTVTKTGAGNLTLAGVNTYAGGTTITSGTLTGSALSFGTGAIENNAALVLDQTTDATLANAISGTGTVTKTGAGNLTLAGVNTYAGGTTISAGTLTGSALNFGTGAIVDNAALVLDQATDAMLANAISGTGTVTKTGAGNLTLAGVNTYAGGTTITAGTLTGTVDSFGAGGILSNAALVLDQATDASFANAISGAGSFTKAGAGMLTLTGDSSSFTGATTISMGGLTVNGSLVGSIVTAQGGTVLSGSGTVGGVVALGGSRINPGNGLGTLTVTGDFLQHAGSTYSAEVIPGGTTSDLIAVAGVATIENGAVLSVSRYSAGGFSLTDRYTVLTATGGVSGTYTIAGDTAISAFYSFGTVTESNAVYLEAQQNRSFSDAAWTPNQIATAGGLQSLVPGNIVRDAIGYLPTDAAARDAFDQLSGEIHASAKAALFEDSRFIRIAVNDRLRGAFDSVGASGTVTTYIDGKPVTVNATTDRLAVWGQGFGSWGHTDGDGNAATLNRKTGGFFVGADAPVFDTLRFGAVAGYSRTDFDVKSRHSSGASDNYHLGLYGGTAWGDLAFRTGAAYTWNDISTSRNVAFAGFGDSLKGGYNAATAQVFGELAYGFSAGGARFEPFANLAYVNLRTDGFTEPGGAAALTGASSNAGVTFTTLGLRASTTFAVGDSALTAKGMVGWRHSAGDVDTISTMRFAGGGDAFAIGGVPITRDAAVVEAGIDYVITPNAMLGVTYGGQFGSGMSDQSFRANLNIKF